jgi:uncharacterized protein involved in exopolysaccharide biosynthesis
MTLREETRPREPPLPDFEAEREVDVGQAARQVAARWWLLVAGLAAGMAVGYLVALGGGDFYEAEATISLGQPFTPTGSAPVQGLATNPSTVGRLARSEEGLDVASRASGMREAELRGNISTGTVSGVSRRTTPGVNPLVELSVQGERRLEVQRAAQALADYVVREVSGYVAVKIRSLNEELQALEQAEQSLEERLAAQDAALRAAQERDAIEQLVLVSQKDNTEQRLAVVTQDRLETRGLLALAENVEQATVVTEPISVETSARSTRNSIIVGGLIGLLLGTLAALLWEPVVERRLRNRPA